MLGKVTFPKRLIEDLVEEICQESGWRCRTLAGGWVIEIQNDDKIARFCDYELDINPAASNKIAYDKAATSEVLAFYNLPALPHQLLSHYLTEEIIEQQIANLKVKYPLVAKPNEGSDGREIKLINTPAELRAYARGLRKRELSTAVSPFVQIEAEYRVVMLDGNPLISYEKKLPSSRHPLLKQHNLSHGATPEKVNDSKLKATLATLAKDVMTCLNLRFASIDIIKANGKLSVIEANSGVTFNIYAAMSSLHRQEAKEAYRAALLTMFS